MVSDSLLVLMKKSGCTGITIGAESADDNVLKHMKGKPITRQDIKKFAYACKRLKLRTHLCWVLGMPYSTKESDMETIKFALEIPFDTLQFSICIPFPGTEMYDWCLENGYLIKNGWKNIKGNDRSIVNYPRYSSKEIKDMQDYALRLWHKKMLFNRPDIVFFRLYNLYKYQGIKGMITVSLKNLRELI